MASATAASAVKGGATATCTLPAAPSSIGRSARTSSRASPVVLNIFQLPQTNFWRAMIV